MPKQSNPSKTKTKAKAKAKPPAAKRPKRPSTPLFSGLFPMVSPELLQPSTNTKPSFNRQAGELPNLNAAREIFRRSHGRIMADAPRRPQAQVQAQAHARSAVAAFTEKTLFEKLLTEHQEEIRRLRKELALEKEENAELRSKLAAQAGTQQGLTSKKRKRLGARLCEFEH